MNGIGGADGESRGRGVSTGPQDQSVRGITFSHEFVTLGGRRTPISGEGRDGAAQTAPDRKANRPYGRQAVESRQPTADSRQPILPHLVPRHH